MSDKSTTFAERQAGDERFFIEIQELYKAKYEGQITDYLDFCFCTLLRAIAFETLPEFAGAVGGLSRELEELDVANRAAHAMAAGESVN